MPDGATRQCGEPDGAEQALPPDLVDLRHQAEQGDDEARLALGGRVIAGEGIVAAPALAYRILSARGTPGGDMWICNPTTRQSLDRGDRRVAVTPGMAVTADIRTGQRSLLELLISPIEEVRASAGRER